jgi:hypothetical protein
VTIGHEDRGILLYQNRWRWPFIILGFIFILGFLSVAFFGIYVITQEWDRLAGNDDPRRFIGLAMVGVFLFGAVYIGTFPFREMPNKIYERGVTLNQVSLRDGLRGREAFVPSEDISHAKFKRSHHPKYGESRYFHLTRFDGESFNFSVKHGDEEFVAKLLKHVLRCEVEGPEE